MDTLRISRQLFLVLATASILLLSAAPSAMAGLEGVDVHGFASQGYMASTEYNYITPSLKGSWAMSEYAVNIGKDLNENLRVGVQFFARNLGDLGQNEVGVDWAFGDYRVNDWLGIRGGRVKMPYGFYNETADFDHVRTSVLMPQSVYDLRMRDFRIAVNGINPYGYLDLESGGSLEYSALLGFVSHPKEGSFAKFFLAMGGLLQYRGMENEHTIAGQIIWNTPLEGLRIGHTINHYKSGLTLELDPMTAAYMGVDPVQQFPVDDMNFNTSSVEFSYGNVTLAGEYNNWKGAFSNDYFGFQVDWENWYAQGSYRVNPWMEMGTYYSVHYENRKDREGKAYDPNFKGWQKDLALSLRFDVSPNMIFKLEGHRMDGVASVFNFENEAAYADPSSMEQNWYIFASKVSFVF